MKWDQYGFKVAEIGEYTYNYRYLETTVSHHIREYFGEEEGTRIITVQKETRRNGDFVQLPQSIWITKEGYPPLSTDGALQQLGDNLLTLYFAGLPTVQSEEHISIFDSALSEELKTLNLDYGKLSEGVKAGQLFKGCTITGFVYTVRETHDLGCLEALQEKVLKSYAKVLSSKQQKCPIEFWTEMIMEAQADFEYHLFRKWGFDVPLAAQRAFFTIMMGLRTSYLKSNDDLEKLHFITALSSK